MFKLIKLAFYGLIGYALYEFMRGLMQGERALQAGREQGGGRDLDRALDDAPAPVQNMTGPARGQTVTTEDSSGESVRHKVGRGVVSR